jgi:hypothetical protein
MAFKLMQQPQLFCIYFAFFLASNEKKIHFRNKMPEHQRFEKKGL